MQRFLDGPQGVLAARRFHQDETVRIKPKCARAVAVQAAVAAKPISRDDEKERVNARKTGQQRHHKTKGGRQCVWFGDDLMQRAAGKAALRQIAIDGGKAEGNWRCLPNPFHFRQ